MSEPNDEIEVPPGPQTVADQNNSALPVPQIPGGAELERAEAEEKEQYPGEKQMLARREGIALRKLELENQRIENANTREDIRENAEMETRHRLASFVVWVLCPAWLVFTLGIIVATGKAWLVLTDTVLLALISANPLGIAGVLWIVVSYFFPKRPG